MDEIDRLSPKKTEETRRSISDGLSELDKLKSSNMPNYDHPWVPLLHASWYHLRHVNFLQTVLADRLKQHANAGEIRVVDYGCGTMPVMWAIALVLANPENELTQQKISIYNYDPCTAMLDFGRGMWEKLRTVIWLWSNPDEGRRLYDATSRITVSTKKFGPTSHLLTAIHCLYDKKECRAIKKSPVQNRCVTLHRTKANKLGLTIQKSANGPWSGNLEELTEFRRIALGSYCTPRYKTRPHKHLSRLVTWNSSGVVLVKL